MESYCPAPRPIEPGPAATLRRALQDAAFDDRVFRVVGALGDPDWKRTMRGALSGLPTEACRVMVRFFMIRDAVPRAELDAALGGPEVVPALERAGLAFPDAEGGPDGWRCPVILIPAADAWAFSDRIDDPATENVPEDYILPVGRTTRYVDDLAVRVPCGLAVDIGCGQGFLSIRALRHAQRAIATDINPRAVAFAACNGSLAGVGDALDCRLGSFFEPLQDVKGRIDLLTCNPPFVIHPGGQTVAVATPMEGDGMFEHLVRTTPSMLAPEGWATLVGLWEHAQMGDPVSRVARWLEGSGCDVLVYQFRTYQPEEYLRQWIAPDAQAAALPGFRELCRRRSIGAITFGCLILRKRAGLNWMRSMFTLINLRTGPASEQVRDYFHTQTRLQSMTGPADLLRVRLRVARGWRFDPAQPMPMRVPAPAPGQNPPQRGLPLALNYAQHYEPLLPAFTGEATARDVLAELHRSGRITVPPEDPQALAMIQALTLGGHLDIID